MNKKTIILFFPLIESGEIFTNIPWALLSLERMIRHLDIDVVLIDERLDPDYTDIIKKNKDNLLFAGISAIIGYQIAGGVKFTKTLRTICNVPVIWGGWFPTVIPDIILKDGYADYICVGPGELPFKSFTEKILTGEDVSKISGIGFIKKGVVYVNPNENFTHPDSFTPVNKDLIDVNRLIDINGKVPVGQRNIDYLASTGCPQSCGFCSVVQVYKNKWFSKKIPDIIDDLRYFKEKASISNVTFWDENIFASKKFVIDFCNELIKSELNLTWSGYAHIGYFLRNFSEEEIQLIYKAGCREIRLGSESGDQEVLDLIKKKIQVNDTLKILKLLKKYNIRSRIFLIACFPLNPEKDFWMTLNLVGRALLIDRKLYAKIRFFVPIPNTSLYQLSIEKGFKTPSSTYDLMDFFTHRFTVNYKAPWCKKDYNKYLDYYENFYFLLVIPGFYRSFSLIKRPLVFLLTFLLYPFIFLRFKWNIMKYPFEAIIFRNLIRK